MKNFGVSALFLAGLLVVCIQCDEKKPEPPKVGEPQFSLQAAGSGNSGRNFQMGYNAGVGTKVWESRNKDRSLELGVNYGRGIARVDGRTYKSPPQFGLGATFRFGRK